MKARESFDFKFRTNFDLKVTISRKLCEISQLDNKSATRIRRAKARDYGLADVELATRASMPTRTRVRVARRPRKQEQRFLRCNEPSRMRTCRIWTGAAGISPASRVDFAKFRVARCPVRLSKKNLRNSHQGLLPGLPRACPRGEPPPTIVRAVPRHHRHLR